MTAARTERPTADELRAEVLRLAALPAYQHPAGSPNPACVAGSPNASRIADAPTVRVTRARVQQILREARGGISPVAARIIQACAGVEAQCSFVKKSGTRCKLVAQPFAERVDRCGAHVNRD